MSIENLVPMACGFFLLSLGLSLLVEQVFRRGSRHLDDD